MSERNGIFAGDNPFEIARRWLGEAEEGELNDPNAIALSTVDVDGLPNVRMVLLKAIDEDSFVFYTITTVASRKRLHRRARPPLFGIQRRFIVRYGCEASLKKRMACRRMPIIIHVP